MSDLNPNLPEFSFDLSSQEVRTVRRKLKAKWSVDSGDDLRRLLNRLQPGDYVLDKLKDRVIEVLKVATTYDMVTEADATYEVADILNDSRYTEKDRNLGTPLNEMEVLAYATR